MKKALLFLLVGIFCLVGTSTFAYETDRIYKLTILHTNDHHGRFWKNRNGEYGMSARRTLIEQIRKEVGEERGYVLLLSGGDINTGVPESDMLKAEPDFKGMKMLNYDAMAVGNHEFDNSLETIRMQESWVDFPFLSANIFYKGTDKCVFKAYEEFEFRDLNVTVLGFTTNDTPILSNPENVKDFDFVSPIESAKMWVPELRKKSDILIAVTHMGHYKDGNHGRSAPGDVSLARSIKGIDVIVGGHSQNPVFEPDFQNGTMILQAQEWGKYVGRLDLEFLNGKTTLKSYRLIPVNLKKKIKVDDEGSTIRVYQESEITEDSEMLKMLKPYYEKGQAQLSVKVGETNGTLVGERAIVRSEETNLGNLIGASMRAKTGADVAIMGGGGIRTSIEEGKITYKDVLQVHPFGNTLTTVTLSKSELWDYLEKVGNFSAGSGAFVQFSGVELTYEGSTLVDLKVGGEMVMDSKSYKIVIPNFSAAGGDGYPKVSGHPTYVDTGYSDANSLREYINNNSPLDVANYAPTGDVIRK